jgi:DNA repair exonuclease SbcCD ATPase subunit
MKKEEEGMSRSKADIEADIQSCSDKIAELEAVLELLTEYQTRLSEDHTDYTDNVKTPVDEYDFAENDDWLGKNEGAAETIRETLSLCMTSYDNDITKLEGQIAEAIEKINSMIEEENERLAQLQEELDNWTEDPVTSDGTE